MPSPSPDGGSRYEIQYTLEAGGSLQHPQYNVGPDYSHCHLLGIEQRPVGYCQFETEIIPIAAV